MVNTISAGFASRLDAEHQVALQDKPGAPLDLSDIPAARRMAAERDAVDAACAAADRRHD